MSIDILAKVDKVPLYGEDYQLRLASSLPQTPFPYYSIDKEEKALTIYNTSEVGYILDVMSKISGLYKPEEYPIELN